MHLGAGFTVTLQREWNHQPWGLRLAGGCDLDKPLQVTRVAAGSPANRVLKPGDLVLQIDGYDARDIRHQDALTLFANAERIIKLVIQRDGEAGELISQRSSREASICEPDLGLPRAPNLVANKQPIAAPLFLSAAITEHARTQGLAEGYMDQPYRTTPLVLPGAKVKKDLNQNESYLRHHPNPMFRQAPPHPLLTHEAAMKQKVADSVLQQKYGDEISQGKQVINKQFNTPIGLYSEQNIVDQISQQTGHTVAYRVPNSAPSGWQQPSRPSPRKTVVFDPAKSETYKALQDEALGDHVQEVTTPVMPKVFTPSKEPRVIPVHPVPGPHSQHVNSVGAPSDEIQQSYTFKRLMQMVQGESVY